MSICVVVADSSKARILLAESGHGALTDDRDFVHSESRLREQELVSDGTGNEIDKLRRNSDLHRVYLVASPKFLGLLRSSMSKQCTELLVGEINKDLVNQSIEDIRSHLPKQL